MEHVSLEGIMKKTNCRYGLVLAAAARANELLTGDQPLIDAGIKKATSVAIEEIAQGKVEFKLGPA